MSMQYMRDTKRNLKVNVCICMRHASIDIATFILCAFEIKNCILICRVLDDNRNQEEEVKDKIKCILCAFKCIVEGIELFEMFRKLTFLMIALRLTLLCIGGNLCNN